MRAADARTDFSPAQLDSLFAPLRAYSHVLLALSGGPDSTALTVLTHRWRGALPQPGLSVATVDHGLRADARREAAAAAGLSRSLGLDHAILAWEGAKPDTGLQDAARDARYDLLVRHARAIGADAIALAHTQDDQAETVLFRLSRGSGVSGLGGMQPVSERSGLALVRPFLDVPKARLLGFLEAEGIAYASDPSNLDLRHARPRWRALAPALAAEGLTAARLAMTARRLARADMALKALAGDLALRCRLPTPMAEHRYDAGLLFAAPQELSLRVLRDALGTFASEGEVELGKAERLHAHLVEAFAAQGAFTGTLAGALARLESGTLHVSAAPKRNKKSRLIAPNSTR
ncbi:MAG: tRNA lysidine(34) synthetase TilS [Pseudomonadota bacterium]